jgi:UDP-N-acetyl-D-mannosaminuronic acid transferase (WecB/TagA/CpsF family)
VKWLAAQGIHVGTEHTYVAPQYDPDHVFDDELVLALEKHRPAFVVLNVGGGIQEPLGLYLRESLSYAPAIVCTGAAIAFLSGTQAPIPNWVDRAGLGWLARCIEDPARFVPRYLSALRLAFLVMRFGHRMPPLTSNGERA